MSCTVHVQCTCTHRYYVVMYTYVYMYTHGILQMARRKKTAQQEENVALGPQVPEGEEVFGVCHIFASFNDTFVHVTDLSGR